MLSGEEIQAKVAEAVAEAKDELNFTEPLPAREASVAPPAEAAGDEDDDGPPSAEALAKIEADPEARAIYGQMVRARDEAMSALSAQRGEAEQAMQVVSAIREDPEGTVRALASAAGVRLAEQPQPLGVLETVRDAIAASVGTEAAEVLAPAVVNAVVAVAGPALNPIYQDMQAREKKANDAQLAAGIEEFKRKVADSGGEWDAAMEHEMAALTKKVKPGPDTTLPDYLETLHSTVMRRRERSGVSRKSAPPARRQGSTAVVRVGMPEREATAAAVAAAMKQLGVR